MLGIIMAGGQGSRLMPLTLTRPKPMVEVLGRPVIDYVKDAMVEAGICDIVVTTGYRGEQLDAHVQSWNGLREDGRPVQARINQEATPMGTAGSVGLLRDHIKTTCVVGSGDAVASFDIQALLEVHRSNQAKVTMALWEVEDPSPFGIVGLSALREGPIDGELREGFIQQFMEKPSPEEAFSNVINAGLYILEPEVFDHIPLGEKFDFSKQLFPKLLSLDWPMYAKTIDGVWFDVGQPFELLQAQQTLMEEYDSLPFTFPQGYGLKDDSLVASSADVNGLIERSMVGGACRLASDSLVVSSMLMDGCSIAHGAVVYRSVLGRNVVVGKGCTVEGSVIGDDVVLEPGQRYTNQRIPAEDDE